MLFAAMSTLRLFVAALAALAALLAGCSSGSDASAETAPTTTAPVAASSSTTTSTVFEVVTTIQRVPADELTSTGTISIGSTDFDFAFECYAAGAGDILALGVGSDPDSGADTQAIVQAFLGQNYVGVLEGEDVVREIAVDAPAELFVQGDAIVGSALRFIERGGAPGIGEDLGLGSVTVSCDGFAPGLPEGYDLS